MNNKETSALIGYTGFVGSTLMKKMLFTHLYRRTNIHEIAGQTFDHVICSGMPAEKWKANQNPEADNENTYNLIHALSSCKAKEFVLISTIDIYHGTTGCHEGIVAKPGHTYGQNRLRLEEFVKERFPNYYIIRLPALFGNGLKKNAIYDLQNNNQIEKINPASRFQWYDLEWLSDDIKTCIEQGVREVNLFTEPISMKTIADLFFSGIELNPDASFACYDHRTRSRTIQGGPQGEPGYRATAQEVLDAMGRYIEATR
jgi:dTDP-4-dehydrorhamnose reductase